MNFNYFKFLILGVHLYILLFSFAQFSVVRCANPLEKNGNFVLIKTVSFGTYLLQEWSIPVYNNHRSINLYIALHD